MYPDQPAQPSPNESTAPLSVGEQTVGDNEMLGAVVVGETVGAGTGTLVGPGTGTLVGAGAGTPVGGSVPMSQ